MTSRINNEYPLGLLHSVEELMDVAMGVEREAALRYDQLSTMMDKRGDQALAVTFRELAEIERAHEAGLAAWTQRRGETAPIPKQFQWQLPETFSLDDVGAAPISSYQALAIAVRNEEQAFVFYTYVAAQAHAQADLRDRAEALAKEELAHVAQLRRLRRRAFHADHNKSHRPLPVPQTLPELYSLALGVEKEAADLAATAARCLIECDGHGAETLLIRRVAEDARLRAETMASQSSSLAEASRENSRTAISRGSGALTAGQALDLCERDAQEGLEIYLSIAERTQDDVILHQTQILAEAAMARLALIRGGIGAK